MQTEQQSLTFHIEEYKSLRSEVLWMLKDYGALERNVALLCGGLLAWLFKDIVPSRTWTVEQLAWFLPLIFAVLGSIRAYGLFKAFNIFHEYFVKVEQKFATSGWESYIGEGEEEGEDARPRLGTYNKWYIFWVTLGLTTLVAAVYFGTPISNCAIRGGLH